MNAALSGSCLGILLISMSLTFSGRVLGKSLSGEFDELCRKSGVVVNEIYQGVPGFVDGSQTGCSSTCRDALLRWKYDFIEAYSPGSSDENYTSGAGLFRFTLEKIGHPQCVDFERWNRRWVEELLSSRGPTRYPGFEGKCIATWPIQVYSAQFEVTEVGTIIEVAEGHVGQFVTTVINRDSHSIVAQSTILSLTLIQSKLHLTQGKIGIPCDNSSRSIFVPAIIAPASGTR